MASGFANVAEYVDALATNGQVHSTTFRKVPSQATAAGQWADLSMSGNIPLANYYAAEPLVADTLDGNRGIHHGADKSPAFKYLAELGLTTPTAGFVGQFKLLDYLLYYPFVDMDSADPQAMDNTVTLPRYATGDGVMVMAVAVTPSVGGGQFTFDYYNQDGVLKTSPTQLCNSGSVAIATLVNSLSGTTVGRVPWLQLASGDTGVRSIVSLTNTVTNGGLISLVLVKPLCDTTIREVNTTTEIQFLSQRMPPPRIYDGAYLNLLVNCAASIAAGTLLGQAKFVWN